MRTSRFEGHVTRFSRCIFVAKAPQKFDSDTDDTFTHFAIKVSIRCYRIWYHMSSMGIALMDLKYSNSHHMKLKISRISSQFILNIIIVYISYTIIVQRNIIVWIQICKIIINSSSNSHLIYITLMSMHI